MAPAVLDNRILDIVEDNPFPAPTKQAAGLVKGVHTDVSSIYFSDKIMITISQGGRLSQWIQVPLSTTIPTGFGAARHNVTENDLPLSNFSPTTLIGSGGEKRETLGHLYANQIACIIAMRNNEESRTVVVGLGLEKVETDRDAFFDMVELLQKVI